MRGLWAAPKFPRRSGPTPQKNETSPRSAVSRARPGAAVSRGARPRAAPRPRRSCGGRERVGGVGVGVGNRGTWFSLVRCRLQASSRWLLSMCRARPHYCHPGAALVEGVEQPHRAGYRSQRSCGTSPEDSRAFCGCAGPDNDVSVLALSDGSPAKFGAEASSAHRSRAAVRRVKSALFWPAPRWCLGKSENISFLKMHGAPELGVYDAVEVEEHGVDGGPVRPLIGGPC